MTEAQALWVVGQVLANRWRRTTGRAGSTERGDVTISTLIWASIAIVVAVTIGAIYREKLTDFANGLDLNG